jgi:methionyl-tRNA formyltransferase
MLSCNRLLTPGQLALHKNNIVVHESDLPKGRGWSPLTWQIEAGKNEIPITLFEAARQCDAGIYYLKDKIRLKGNELIDDARKKQAEKTIEMINKYLTKYPMRGVLQEGRATYYRRRKMQDSMLNIHKSITSQFNKMRVADNQRYPLYFTFKGKKYILKIYEKKE